MITLHENWRQQHQQQESSDHGREGQEACITPRPSRCCTHIHEREEFNLICNSYSRLQCSIPAFSGVQGLRIWPARTVPESTMIQN